MTFFSSKAALYLAFAACLWSFAIQTASAQTTKENTPKESTAPAQTSIFDTPRSLARSGNDAYTNKRFKEAEEQYRASLEKDKNLAESTFNLGDAFYKQGKFEDAVSQFRSIAENARAPKEMRSQSFHNLGNSLLKSQKLAESIDAYKNALRLNPNDDDTRHNLALAKQMLVQQQKQQQQNQQNQENNQDQQQQNQQQQKQDNNQDQQQNKQPQPPNPQQSQPQPKLSKADAERILEALNNDERNVQKKLIKRKASGVVIEKDW